MPAAPLRPKRRRAYAPADRPETAGLKADDHYDEGEVARYDDANGQKQRDMAERCLAMVGAPDGDVVLDVGCGSCLGWPTGRCAWIGFDVSRAMLEAAADEGAARGAVARADAAAPLPLRRSLQVDASISVSAVQWLADGSGACARLCRETVERLAPGAALAWQVYPPNDEAAAELERAPADACCAAGGIVGDFPHRTKAVKFFVVGLKRAAEGAAGGTDVPPRCVLCYPHRGGCALWWHWRRGTPGWQLGEAPPDDAPAGVARLWEWHVREARRHARLEARASDEAALAGMKPESRAALLAVVAHARASRAAGRACPWFAACWERRPSG